MVAAYRLNSFGFILGAGTHVVPREEFVAIEGADALLTAAELACDELRDRAVSGYQAERRRGYEDGLADARLEAMDRLLREGATLDHAMRDIEGAVVRIVAESVGKLVTGFDDARRAEAVVHAALVQMRRERRAELRVPPALVSHFRARIADILLEFPEVEFVDVVEDRSLEPTHIVFETSIGRVSGNIQTSLEDLRELILGGRSKETVDMLDGFEPPPREGDA